MEKLIAFTREIHSELSQNEKEWLLATLIEPSLLPSYPFANDWIRGLANIDRSFSIKIHKNNIPKITSMSKLSSVKILMLIAILIFHYKKGSTKNIVFFYFVEKLGFHKEDFHEITSLATKYSSVQMIEMIKLFNLSNLELGILEPSKFKNTEQYPLYEFIRNTLILKIH